MKRRRTAVLANCVALVLSLGVAACSGNPLQVDGKESEGQTVTVAAVWSGGEQRNFQKVLDTFTEKTGIKTRYISTGGDFPAVIGRRIEEGNAPDVAMVPQIGVLRQFARKGWLKPLPLGVRNVVGRSYAKVWIDYGTVDGVLYGLYFKATNKSTVWYNSYALARAQVVMPSTFEEMMEAGRSISASGHAAFAVAGGDGWTLTDWFENVYLSQAGADKYDALAAHRIKWTDPTVVEALTTLGALFGNGRLIAGGREGALKTNLADSVGKVFGPEPEAAMVYEGDFILETIGSRYGRAGFKHVSFSPFPAVGDGEQPLITGGDAAVVLRDGADSSAGMKLVEYLGTPEAAAVWAKERGGFLSPNRKLDLSTYGSLLTSAVARSLINREDSIRFDMSDQAPPAFGATKDAGEWKILQDFLRDPSDPKGTAAKLEAAAAAAY